MASLEHDQYIAVCCSSFGQTYRLSSYKFLISELVGPVDFSDLTEAALMKDIHLSHISFRYSPNLRAI